MNDPRESMEGAPLLGTPKAAYSNVPKRLSFGSFGWWCILSSTDNKSPEETVGFGYSFFRGKYADKTMLASSLSQMWRQSWRLLIMSMRRWIKI